MSDPAKSANEIEDVLASIRRLVSESHTAPAPAIRPAGEPARLVLTPAQRITEPDDPWAPVPSAEAVSTPDEGRDESNAEDPAWGLEDRLSDWGEIEGSAREAVEDAIAERADEAPPGPAGMTPVDIMADETLDGTATFEFESETGDADWPDQAPSRALRDLALVRGHGGTTDTDTDALGSPADAATDADAEVAADADAATVTEVAETMEQDTDLAAETAAVAVETAEPAAERQAVGMAEGIARVFSRRVEVRRPTDIAQAPPPDEAPEDHGLAAEDMDEIEDGIADDIEDLGEEAHPFTFPDPEDGLLDEETLREIIAEVVREELQGALGQRITRNVRKMVRREIRLALAAQDLE